MASAISSVVSRLGEMAVAEAALLRGVDDYIPLLRDKLEWMQTFIQQESGQEGGNAYMDLWVRQTREVAYQVEDVLDEFVTKVDLDKAGGLPAWERWLRYIGGCATHVTVRHDLRARMDAIKNRLKDISENANTYKVDKLRSNNNGASASASASCSSVSPMATWDEETDVVGCEDTCLELQNHLLSSDTGRSIISIIGESGVGKSTLVRKVYDSHIIREKFDVRAWINVSPQIRDDDFIGQIYNGLFSGSKEYKSVTQSEEAHEGISLHLMDKRYLVTVDGVVGNTNWNSIFQSLPKNGKGSRIILITGHEDKEAAYAHPRVHPLKISNLSLEDCTMLFNRKAFGACNQFRDDVSGSRSLQDKELLDKVCMEILELTRGLPLAIVVLAGLLRSKGIEEWIKVFNQLKSSDKPKQVKMILALSFDDLPSRLKSCFLYFAGMPKNMVTNAKRLVRLWAAEGFLNPDDGETMEETGQYYLKELISRGLVNLVKKDQNGGVWLVAVHGCLQALAQEKAREANFLEVHDNSHAIAPGSVRRLHLENYMQSYAPIGTSFPKMRSILGDFAEERVRGSLKNQGSNIDLRDHALRFLTGSKFLRVIDLRGLRIRKVPHAIGGMVHVRYLGLRSRSLAELPSSIGRLINLQTLDIKRTEVEKVAQAFWEIPTLRHVVASKLRLPKSAGVLNDMQTLQGLVCSDPMGNTINPLHNMVHLRCLDISGITKWDWVGLHDVFRKLNSLLYLRLCICQSDIPFKVFTRFNLRRLKTLELSGKFDTSDASIKEQGALPSLTRLVLKLSMADQALMNMLGELPNLMELVLSEASYDGEKLTFSDGGFSNLTSLVMANLTELSEWTIRPRSIPKIKSIALSGCSKMKIKFEGEGLLEELDEVVLSNMPPEGFIVEPANSGFSDKFNRLIKRQ